MKRLMLNRVFAAIAVSAAVALPARAVVVDFEDVAATLFNASSISSGGLDFASSGAGFSGVDSAAAFVFGNAPANSSGQFLFALNTDTLTMTQGGNAFRLLGLDASFVAPLGNLGVGLTAGMLHVVATTGSGVITDDFDFGLSDATGNWNFSAVSNSAWASGVTSVSFSACVYVGLAGCSFTDSLAQFALDNIHVPEPTSAVLALAALGLLAATRRRQSL